MPAPRLSMRKIREVLRLKHERGLSHRAIAQTCAIGVGTVTLYLQRTARHGLGWPLPVELDDAALEARLYPRPTALRNRVGPDCAHIHRELKRDGVTLQLLWEEYARVHPDGYGRTRFCEIYRQWARRLRPSMRQVHRAGEKTFVDFSGKRPTLVDRRTGELRRVELFVAVLRASSFTYAEAVATQQLADWVGAHTRMVEYFGGATALWVPDQLKSAVTRPCRYEPDVNRSYEDLAAHYGAVVVPARPRKPRDKSSTRIAAAQPPSLGVVGPLSNPKNRPNNCGPHSGPAVIQPCAKSNAKAMAVPKTSPDGLNMTKSTSRGSAIVDIVDGICFFLSVRFFLATTDTPFKSSRLTWTSAFRKHR